MAVINKKRQDTEFKPYHVQFAEQVISMLEEGTAPWQKPWKGGDLSAAPHNDANGTRYSGINRIMLSWLSMSKYGGESRYMTLPQANELGYRVKKGEHGQSVVYWQFTKEQDKRDENGAPVLGPDGQPEKENVRLERPIAKYWRVFNVSQLQSAENGAPYPALDDNTPRFSWNPEEKAEAILTASGANIEHQKGNRAFYRASEDKIVLPEREQFPDAAGYYDTALHELGHWTGHESRLNRNVRNPFGSPEYAREELRAEIASWMMGQDLGIAHDPGQHAAYVENWIQALKNDPYEIVRAASDAERIKEYVMGLDREQKHALADEEALGKLESGQESSLDNLAYFQRDSKPQQEDLANNRTPEAEPSRDVPKAPAPARETAKDVTWLTVPYSEKNAAKKAGARWDPAKTLWYAPAGADLTPLKQWLPEKAPVPEPRMNPREEFAAALQEAGLDLGGTLPEMDGRIHRVPLVGRPQGKDGAYVGYLDGRPSGHIQNFVTGEKRNWTASGHRLSEEQLATLRAESEERQRQREAARQAEQDRVAKMCSEIFEQREQAASNHLYLQTKGVYPHGIRQSPDGKKLIVPLRNTEGEIRTVQIINEDGSKFFEKGGQKYGCYHLIGADRVTPNGEILLAEGYATGASLYECVKKPVAICFDAGNMDAVGKALREKYPQAQLTFCADNDVRRDVNIGVEKAEQAARGVRGRVVVPQFDAAEIKRGLKDFNDLHQTHGEKAVREQVARQRQTERSLEQ